MWLGFGRVSTKSDTPGVNLVLKTEGIFFASRVDAPQKFSRVVEFLHFRAISAMCSFFLILEGEEGENDEKKRG